ncbi:hypothetical protein BgiMline_014442 [Biomphalaria glabrata]|uniref:Uncharacterized protein LOC129926174 n=1 Tax=Biomphalaria glabrata TaxID=6526 RepID=A0A9W3AB38_BIOGL|nr:uncharacterized protein LOC129926174 [Biomphalaria glabrata]XP_055884498.1 uncharacterized protein LOC129926174 [Biomphalaria glabrata]
MSTIKQSLIEHDRQKYKNVLLIFQFQPGDTEQRKTSFCSQILSLFDINGQLKIHPWAFHGLTYNEKIRILDVTEQLKKGNLRFSQCVSIKVIESILKNYELQFDRQIFEREKQLSVYFNQNLRDVTINERTIFDNIKPSEIKRLFDLLRNNAKLKTNLPLMVVFAGLNQVSNVSDFCACGEFIYRALSKSTNGTAILQNLVSKESKAIENFMENDAVKKDYKNRFTVIVNRCSELMVNDCLHFSSPMTFANHFSKHGAEVCPSDQVNEETYLRLANEHVMQGHDRVKVILTQDGTSIKHTYKFDQKLAIVIEDVKTGRKCIATFFKPRT